MLDDRHPPPLPELSPQCVHHRLFTNLSSLPSVRHIAWARRSPNACRGERTSFELKCFIYHIGVLQNSPGVMKWRAVIGDVIANAAY